MQVMPKYRIGKAGDQQIKRAVPYYRAAQDQQHDADGGRIFVVDSVGKGADMRRDTHQRL